MGVKGNQRLKSFWRSILIALLSVCLYLPTITYDFTLDDAIVIYDNQFTQEGFSGIPDLLKYDTFRGFFKVEGKSQLVSGGRYRPLSPVIFAVLWDLSGGEPWLFHLVNILLYSGLCLSLFHILRKIIPRRFQGGEMLFAAVLLFVVHPVHVEVVANVKGMDEILSLLFGAASLYYLVKKRTVLSASMMLLALLSKEMAITWLPVMVAYLVILQKTSWRNALVRPWPVYLATTVYLIIRLSVLGWPSSEPILEMMNNPFVKLEGGQYVMFSGPERLATIAHTLWEYMRLLFFPHPLTHDYYPRHIGVMNWNALTPWIGLISHIILFFLVMRSKDRKPILSFAIAFYLLGLTLISNIIFPIGTHMGERFIFMSSLGFCLALGWLWHNGIKQHSLKTGILILVLGALSFLTVKRSAVWKDDHALFTSDVMTSYNSAKALNAAGGVIIDRCMDSKESCPDTEIQKAVDYLERATMIHPNYKNAHLIKGNGFFLLNDYKAASQSYRRALDIDPSFRQAKENLVITYNNWAQQLGEQENDVDGAIRVLNRALELDPDNLESLRLAGVAYGVKGDLDRAISFFNRILEIEPDNIGAHRNLGVTHMRLGNEELGKTYLRKAENLKKDTE